MTSCVVTAYVTACGHCHHGVRGGVAVGWSPSWRCWEPCSSTDNMVGPVTEPLVIQPAHALDGAT